MERRTPIIKINMADIRGMVEESLIRTIRENIENEIIAYHGTLNRFNQFNWEKHAGTGEGTNRYGDGIYLTNVVDTGVHYAATIAAKKHDEKSLAIYNKVMNTVSWLERYIKGNKSLRGKENLNTQNFEYWKKIFLACLMGNYQDYPEFFGEQKPYNFPVSKKIGYIVSKEIENIHTWQEFTEWYKDIREKSVHNYKRYLLKVDIPDEGYIRWDDTNPDIMNKMFNIIYQRLGGEINGSPFPKFRKFKNFGDMFDKVRNAGVDSRTLTQIIKTSGILGEKPVVGFIVPTGYGRGGDGRGLNYVIFDNKNVKILERTNLKTSKTKKIKGEN